MEKKPPRPMTPFDEWTVPNELHTLKLLLPYTPAASQPALGMLIKVIELQHTMDYFQQKKVFLHSQDVSSGFSSPFDMLEEISPYLPPEEADMISTFRNMMNIMNMVQMMQTFSDTSESTSDNSNTSDEDATSAGFVNSKNRSSFTESNIPDGQGASPKPDGFGNGFNMNLVMGMLSPKQQEMFEMYQAMFSQQEDFMNTSPEFSGDADTVSETQGNVSPGGTAFDSQDNHSPDGTAFDSQDNHFSGDMAFETQDNHAYSNKERNDLDYE